MQPCSKTLNIAHRGARSLAPENTLAAARKARAIGADMWELDVAMSADGELFVVHDDTLERTSNAARAFPDRRPWSNHTFTLAEIRSLDFGSWFFEPRRQVLEQKGEGIVHEPGVDPVIVVENEDEIVGDCGDVIEQGGEQRLDGRRAARASCCPGNTMTAR